MASLESSKVTIEDVFMGGFRLSGVVPDSQVTGGSVRRQSQAVRSGLQRAQKNQRLLHCLVRQSTQDIPPESNHDGRQIELDAELWVPPIKSGGAGELVSGLGA